jgi:hypothetical protein
MARRRVTSPEGIAKRSSGTAQVSVTSTTYASGHLEPAHLRPGRHDQGRPRPHPAHCKLGTYFHALSTSEALDPELTEAYAAWPDSDPDLVWPRLERRAWLHERVHDPVADGRRRSAALGVSTLTIVRVRNRSFDGYKMFLSPRSCRDEPF